MTIDLLTAENLHGILVGHDAQGVLPAVDADAFDLLLTTRSNAPRPWVSIKAGDEAKLIAAINRQPRAAPILAQVLRLGENLDLAGALAVESLAYSTLLGGAGFKTWLAARGELATPTAPSPLVRIERDDNQLTLTLSDPANRNAMSAPMRDALWDALNNVLDDPTKPSVLIRADGACFSTGGALWEFGTARDLAEAHSIRMARNCALLIDALGPRCSVALHGACIGSGIEIPAAAHLRVARANSWFQLPELGMGLIPGAGGTVTVSRAIGRHRAAWMMLSGRRISAETAFDWGLVHELVP